jgi:hypothetical protein
MLLSDEPIDELNYIDELENNYRPYREIPECFICGRPYKSLDSERLIGDEALCPCGASIRQDRDSQLGVDSDMNEYGYGIDPEIGHDPDNEVINWFNYVCIWVAEPVRDVTEDGYSWKHIDCYTAVSDPGGSRALEYGNRYYHWGMDRDMPDDFRHECFTDAEILFLHSAAHGNRAAYLNLGVLYSEDRCNGEYYQQNLHPDGIDSGASSFPLDVLPPFDRARRSFLCFKRAAEAGDVLGCVNLGNCFIKGAGIEKDPEEAYHWYEKAYQLSDEVDDPVAWGHAALQMAQAHEEGLGCAQSFKTALAYYEKAVAGLSFELAPGENPADNTSPALSAARKGIRRIHRAIALLNENRLCC